MGNLGVSDWPSRSIYPGERHSYPLEELALDGLLLFLGRHVIGASALSCVLLG